MGTPQKTAAPAVVKTAIQKSIVQKSDLFDRIQRCIDEKIRPFIQMDGGEIEIVELTPANVLKVKLHGSCHGCMAASVTLQYGVQNALNEEFPNEDIQLELIEQEGAVPHAPPGI